MVLEKESNVALSERAEEKIREIMSRYPDPHSAVMSALYLAQEELGWISPDAIRWVASRLALPPARVEEVATFYTMYYKKPVGRYHIQLCRTLSCAICGGKRLTEFVKSRLGVAAKEVTDNGLWSWEEVECLGSCGTAPAIQINDRLFENLTEKTLSELMDRIEKELPDLLYSTLRGELGQGLADLPCSQVWQE